MNQPLPTDALDDRIAFVGTAGSGKTYNAGSGVERLLSGGARVAIPDPLGVWYGLALLADGKTPSIFRQKGKLVIFGGPRGDLPLTEHAGALIGETVAGMAESCILDLSELGTKASERRFMLAFLTALYKHKTKEPLHVVFDEADMWAPQRLLDKDGDAAKLLGMMETVVRRGRVRGFIPWLITQRPAVLSKDVLSQIDGLVTFKLTSSQDRDAIGDWVQGQADKAQWREIWGQLPTMERGTGVVWLPARRVLKTAAFPEKATFDSSRTPKRGERVQRAGSLQPVNIDRLKARLAKVEEEKKASDPAKLRAEISVLKTEKARFERQLADALNDAKAAGPAAIEAAQKRGFEQAEKKLRAAANSEVAKRVSAALTEWRRSLAYIISELDVEIKNRAVEIDLSAQVNFHSSTPATVRRPAPTALPQMPSRAKPTTPSVDGDRPLGAERKPLAALARVYPAGMTEAQWAVASALRRSGGTWSTYLSRLRTAGRVEHRGELWFATEQGIADLGGNIEPMPPPGAALVHFWSGKISGIGPMLNRLAEIYPQWTTRDQLAADINLAVSGGTFSTYLSRMRSSGLIEENRDQLRAAMNLMEAA